MILKVQENKKLAHKSGFGLVEVLASMFILALLFMGVTIMNYSNHQAALRIATRNEAMAIGQKVMDSLQTLGVSSVKTDTGVVDGDIMKTTGTGFNRQYRWYDTVFEITSTHGFDTDTVTMVRAKRVKLWVKWNLGTVENKINFETVVE